MFCSLFLCFFIFVVFSHIFLFVQNNIFEKQNLKIFSCIILSCHKQITALKNVVKFKVLLFTLNAISFQTQKNSYCFKWNKLDRLKVVTKLYWFMLKLKFLTFVGSVALHTL